MAVAEKIAGQAALLNVLLAVANVLIVFGLLGTAIAADRAALVQIVLTNLLPLILLVAPGRNLGWHPEGRRKQRQLGIARRRVRDRPQSSY